MLASEVMLARLAAGAAAADGAGAAAAGANVAARIALQAPEVTEETKEPETEGAEAGTEALSGPLCTHHPGARAPSVPLSACAHAHARVLCTTEHRAARRGTCLRRDSFYDPGRSALSKAPFGCVSFGTKL